MPNQFQVFADGAVVSDMVAAYGEGSVQGFTTNPTLMRKAGVSDYVAFAKEVLAAIPDAPISFEVFSDDPAEMERQARVIGGWGENVYVKIPIMNTKGSSCLHVVKTLSQEGIKLNVTAVMPLEQVEAVCEAVSPSVPAIVSVFAGRIADTGVDPVPHMRAAVDLCSGLPTLEVLWASPREVLNIYQAQECGCDIITVTPALLRKRALWRLDLAEYSRQTVQMFHDDATAAGYVL